MKNKRVLVFCLCLPVLAALAGCGDGKVQSTVSEVVSRLGDDVSGTASRVGSALDSMLDDEESRMEDELGSGLEDDLASGLDSGAGSDMDSALASDHEEDSALDSGDESGTESTKER